MIQKILFMVAFAALMNLGAAALPLSHYADDVVLASGSWVKVRVDQSGLYRITASELRKMGFPTLRLYVYMAMVVTDSPTNLQQRTTLTICRCCKV